MHHILMPTKQFMLKICLINLKVKQEECKDIWISQLNHNGAIKKTNLISHKLSYYLNNDFDLIIFSQFYCPSNESEYFLI